MWLKPWPDWVKSQSNLFKPTLLTFRHLSSTWFEWELILFLNEILFTYLVEAATLRVEGQAATSSLLLSFWSRFSNLQTKLNGNDWKVEQQYWKTLYITTKVRQTSSHHQFTHFLDHSLRLFWLPCILVRRSCVAGWCVTGGRVGEARIGAGKQQVVTHSTLVTNIPTQ